MLVKEDMPQSTLSNEQKELIKNNIIDIKRILQSKFKKKKAFLFNKNLKLNIHQAVDEALSYLPEIMINEYDPKKSIHLDFKKFAAQRCFYRIFDHYRKYHRSYLRNNKINRRIIEMSEDGQTGQKEILLEREKLAGKKKFRKVRSNVKTHHGIFYIDSSFVNNIEWEDFKNTVSTKVDMAFKHPTKIGSHHKTDATIVYKSLLSDHIIPKCQGLKYKTLKEISDQLLLSQATLCKILHSDKMKGILTECLALE